jgi:microcystin degradation protein MlrC
MRIFIGGISTETNTFAPWPTGLCGFAEGGVFRGDSATREPGSEIDLLVRSWRDLAAADGHTLFEGLFALAQPSGPTLTSVYEGFRDEIIAALDCEGPFDLVLFYLHGAMTAFDYDDCEGDLIAHARAAVGDHAVIGVELDPHCHLTSLMLEKSDVIILMKEYPHTDFVARAAELYAICVGQAAGRLKPVMAMFDCRMVGFYPTTVGPMAAIVERLRIIEQRPGILSASIVHGFPWGDTPEAGTKSLVVADDDATLAAETAHEIGLALHGARDALLPRFPDIAAALDEAEQCTGRIVLADTADNAGGGAPSDNVSLLRAMLQRGLRGSVFGAVWDPVAAQTCAEAGVGASFLLRLGGKCGPASGEPLDLAVAVRAIRADHVQSGLGGAMVRMGLSAWIEAGGVHILVNSIRTQIFAPDAFTGLGIELGAECLIAVKSTWHFQAKFALIADRIILVATPGALQADFATIEYVKKFDLNFFPRITDPLDIPDLPPSARMPSAASH